MSNEGRGRLDNAIDRAVRGMMHVDPAPGLRGRVEDRLEVPARRAWTLPALATAGALLALIVALALLRTPATNRESEPRVTTAPSAPPAASPSRPQTTTASEPSRVTPVVPSAPIRPRVSQDIFGVPTGRIRAANIVNAVPDPADEAPFEPALPGVVAPITPIMIVPITVAPIQIRPLIVSPIRDQK